MRSICFLLLIIISIKSYSQTNFGNSWVVGLFGYKIKFDPLITHDSFFNNLTGYFYGHSNICDSNGNLFLKCDGMNLYNNNGILIEDGDTLVPKEWYNYNQGYSTYSQTSIILPFENKKYYLITPALNDTQLSISLNFPSNIGAGSCNLLLYHTVDMNANGGQGKVDKRMVLLLTNKYLSKTQMMACKHANGKDWWLLKMAGDSNLVYKFLFTQDSVYNKGVQVIPYFWRGYCDLFGQMIFSQDGTKWATTYCNIFGEVYVSDFDRCTGVLSNFNRITVPPQSTGLSVPNNEADTANNGLCFSPNGNLIYISRYSNLMQYNIQTQTFYKVSGWDTIYTQSAGFSNMYNGPDGKIYIGNWTGTKQMSVIDNPDVSGVGCNFCRKCLRSKSVNGILTQPPCMPNYELGASGQPCWPLSIPNPPKEGVGELVVYPNPSNDKIKVESIKYKDAIKQLYNSIGQLMLSTKENEIDVSNLSSGIYYIRCGNSVKKVMIE